MNKAEFTAEYNHFLLQTGLTTDTVSVGAGGSMLMYGLREETGDIDMGVEPHVFNHFKSLGFKTHWFGNTEVCEWSPLIDLHVSDDKETVVKDGVRTWTLQEVLNFKMGLNRPKDQKDIQVLKDYLNI